MPEIIPDQPDNSKLLATAPLTFLPPSEAEALLAHCRMVSMKPGDQLIRRGRFPAELLIAVAGRLKTVHEEDGTAAAACELSDPYQPIGLDCLLRGAAYPYSVYAEQESTICVIPWRELKILIDRIPNLEAYLRVRAESAFLRDIDLTLEDMACSPAFRWALLVALKLESVPPDTWLIK